MLEGHVERCLWLSLVAVSLYNRGTLAGYISALHLCGDWFFFDRNDPQNGFSMSVVLPVVVLQSLMLESFALLSSLGLILAWRNRKTVVLSVLGALPILVFSLRSLFCWKYGSFLILWWIIHRILSAIVKNGESLVISNLASVVVTQFLSANVPNEDSIYVSAAVAGLLGCGIACWSTNIIFSKRIIWLSLVIQAVVALGFVEAFFWHHEIVYPFPRCLFWLFGDFLLQEESSDAISPLLILSEYGWLIYWGVVLSATIPLSPSERIHPILARKWFHMIALLLFVPVTLSAPKLQSLSYAIALALLLVFETARKQVPLLNQFYLTYLDKSKGETDREIIVSHLALIFGCAAPLWMLQWIEAIYDEKHPQRVLISLWGVLTLGIGDSMGALAGKCYGRTPWGGQQRTMEGSAAMLVSLLLICIVVSRDVVTSLPVVVFVTAMEAFTTQLDNLVLPLAGSSLLLLQNQVVVPE